MVYLCKYGIQFHAELEMKKDTFSRVVADTVLSFFATFHYNSIIYASTLLEFTTTAPRESILKEQSFLFFAKLLYFPSCTLRYFIHFRVSDAENEMKGIIAFLLWQTHSLSKPHCCTTYSTASVPVILHTLLCESCPTYHDDDDDLCTRQVTAERYHKMMMSCHVG